MRQFLRRVLTSLDGDRSSVNRINALRLEFARLSDDQLRAAAAKANQLLPYFAIVAVVASRILGQDMFDVQLRGALALARGSIAEMQTGEGKTLAAVPAVAWFARRREGVHVMTVNDYLARRDACWMGDIYRFLGLSVAYVEQGMNAAERRAAYAADITYATPNEIGFDVLRDRLALRLDEQVHGKLHTIPGQPPSLSRPSPGCPFEPRCEYRKDICKTLRPEIQSRDGRTVACHEVRL